MIKKPCSSLKKYKPKCNHKACWKEYYKQNPFKFTMDRMVLAKYGRDVFEQVSGTKHLKQLEFYIKEKYDR